MPLPPAVPRQHLHTRSVTYRGFLRGDGLWDIEAELSDTKTYESAMERGPLAAGEPIHGMRIRVTLDEKMTVQAIAADMSHTPFAECSQGEDPMQKVVGASMGPGWRQAIEKALGNEKGCTHLRELLFNMATAAYQTVFPYRDKERRDAGFTGAQLTQPSHHMGRCIAWDFNGAVVHRLYPQFVGWQKNKR